MDRLEIMLHLLWISIMIHEETVWKLWTTVGTMQNDTECNFKCYKKKNNVGQHLYECMEGS